MTASSDDIAGAPGATARRRPSSAGFTLIELLVVIAILGVLSAVVVFSVSGVDDRAGQAARATDERILRTAQEAYYAREGHYAPDEATLVDAGLLHNESTYWDMALTPLGRYEICPPGSVCPRYSLSTAEDHSGFGGWLEGLQQGQQPLAAQQGMLAMPVTAPVTSPFGYRVHPIMGTVRFHAGTDFGASSGTPIGAAGDGIVAMAEPRGGYGNVVVIDHGDALATIYAHQSGLAVTEGDLVTTGQTIGYVGSTGFSTGPHLHFEVRELGAAVDPMLYLPVQP